jgi:hypothetical protein
VLQCFKREHCDVVTKLQIPRKKNTVRGIAITGNCNAIKLRQWNLKGIFPTENVYCSTGVKQNIRL